MKRRETLLNSLLVDERLDLSAFAATDIGDDHMPGNVETPLRADAFDKTDEEKMAIIEKHFADIMHTLGMDMTDDSLQGTPKRVAKMYVQEAFKGLNPANKPAVTLFDNKYKYAEMLVEKNITFYSHCEHHFVPIYGNAHVAYMSSGKVIGLSKLHRIIDKSFWKRKTWLL
jgi:GTP cyclohydrolase IA